MTSSSLPAAAARQSGLETGRPEYLDATRAFVLVLGIVFHAGLSFLPVFMGWAVQDVSTSPLVGIFTMVSHSFRMETFFLLAGFLGYGTFDRDGAGLFLRRRMVRLLVPFVIGWFVLRPLLVSGWIMGSASLRGEVDILAGLWGGVQSLSTLPAGLFTGSHLWFLYYLVLVTALTLGLRGGLRATGAWSVAVTARADALVAWLSRLPASVVVLTIPTAGALWFMRGWGMDTPDQSLRPHVPALLIYGGFFGLGWLLARQRRALEELTRLTVLRWIQAGVGVVGILWLGGIEHDPGHPHHLAAHVGFALAYAMTMWSLAFLTLGVFRRFCARPNPFLRYVADASYWMYLVHLPVVVWLQVAVAEWPLHWSLKLGLISAATIAVALVTYDLMVRSTFVGQTLNGRRRERVIFSALRAGLGRLRVSRRGATAKAAA